ncbi:MAG: hypothetical protein A3G33_00345 [Omnitrophica bacterium RIFCSPLOWO2_12_FULL_44_17]|uniref:Addiction module toxin RelE n=1 Tax=Candidatus Danuiimicrobium aquiferis TaxID=1801832 RepID=A0A1G1KVE4_9BACT|nr:MAG: hypothetical protein A3G33_00345 [Omnitrophica bacterium RIFCSPLOWO2_12_FULL_44_17]
MPLRYVFKAVFQKSFDKITSQEQRLVIKAIEALDSYFKHGKASYGLHIKKLYGSSMGQVYEARISIDLRIVWIQTKEEAIFSLLGGHDDVRRFIKNL